jgi:hypothetical protein
MGSISASSDWYLSWFRVFWANYSLAHSAAHNCRRARNRFVKAASTLILQRFLARPLNLVF